MRFFLLMLKNLRRNPLRSVLTTVAVVALVMVCSLIVTFLLFLDDVVSEKSRDVKIIVSERYKFFYPFHYSDWGNIVSEGSAVNRDLAAMPGFHPDKHTVWHFVAFSLDPTLKKTDDQFFAVATLPEKVATMTDGLEEHEVDPSWIAKVIKPPDAPPNAGLVLGAKIMKRLRKKEGDVFEATSVGHREGTGARNNIRFTLQIVGVIPESSRWNEAGFMDYAYLNRVLRAHKNELENTVNWGWLQVDDKPTADQTGGIIERHMGDKVKAETSSTANARFMEPLKDILWGVKYVLVPAILFVMTVILANTFSITVRERMPEMAVLKVLGFPPWRILVLVLGESVLLGALAGLVGAAVTYGLITPQGGIQLPQWPPVLVPVQIFWWGPALGALTAMIGGLWPALSARAVKVTQVFSGVA